MYTKRVEIPQVGETRNLPSVAGEAVDVIRLDWLGAEDPLGNPRLKADRGQIDQPLSERHPVRTDFRGLRIENRDNKAAAGTLALLRIYEDAGNLTQTPPRRQPVLQASDNPQHENIGANNVNDSYGYDLAGNETLIARPRDVAYRATVAVKITTTLRYPDNATTLSSGYSSIEVTLRLESSVLQTINYWITPLGVDGHVGAQLGKDVFVPREEELTVGWMANESDGTGDFELKVEGVALYDPKSQVPPR